jgi:hypothetical protein
MSKLSSINQTYYTIISEAIENSPNKQLFVGNIYEFIQNKYEQYLINNWKNSVRHALSLKTYFIRTKIKENKKCGLWNLDLNCKQDLDIRKNKKIKKKPDETNETDKLKLYFQNKISSMKEEFLIYDKSFL